MKKKKLKKKSWQILQKHHLIYPAEGDELIVKITRTEHFFCGRIEKYAQAHGLSRGFVRAIRFYFRKFGENKLKNYDTTT